MKKFLKGFCIFMIGMSAGSLYTVKGVQAVSPTTVTVAQSAMLGQVDITDAEAIRFVNEVIRPTAEKMRGLDAEIDAALVTWFAGINAKIANDASPILDGREDEGVSRLLGSDVVNMVTQMSVYQTALNQSGVANVVSKPCVRRLEAN
jgi:hypothetical protein